METERAPGSRALMTRGPSGSAVRSNIETDGTGTGPGSRQRPATLRKAGRARVSCVLNELVAPTDGPALGGRSEEEIGR